MSPLAWVLLSAWVLGTWLFTWSLCVAAKRGDAAFEDLVAAAHYELGRLERHHGKTWRDMVADPEEPA